jgi:lipopolysaccharide/colanic/teichoic acid biosynthesis glycosyltransferase
MSSLGFQGATKPDAAIRFPVQITSIAANENASSPTNGRGIVWEKLGQFGSTKFDQTNLVPSQNLYGWQASAKRAFDVLLSGLAIIALMPLFVLVALAIVLESSGPVLFIQAREGKNGKLFRALKFRSMRTDDCDLSGVRQTVVGDSRITKVGSFLRRTSIDELPQLFNVLRGDMSLVGPRPHVKGMLAGGKDYRHLVPYYELRLLVAPGLTGWAQANGLRGPTTNPELARQRIDYDLSYIEQFSFWLDLKIIWMTIKREFVGGSGH